MAVDCSEMFKLADLDLVDHMTTDVEGMRIVAIPERRCIVARYEDKEWGFEYRDAERTMEVWKKVLAL